MSLELSAENVMLLLLAGQGALSSFAKTNYANDSHADKDRIVVKALPRRPALSDGVNTTTKVWLIPVEVTVHFATKSASSMDTIITAVEAANTGTPAAGAVTAAQSAFPNGCRIEDTEDGDTDQETETRERRRVFNFYIVP